MNITLNGIKYEMDEIKFMSLEQVPHSDPAIFQILVYFTNGTSSFYPMTLENVASLNAWLGYLSTFAPAKKKPMKFGH